MFLAFEFSTVFIYFQYLSIPFNIIEFRTPSPASVRVCSSCCQAGPAELEAEDLDETLADARVLRWGEAAVEQVDKYQRLSKLLSLNGCRAHKVTICHHMSAYVTASLR